MLSSRKAVGGLLGLALLLSAPARAAEPSKYVPADAEAVIHINVRQLLDSQLAKKFALPPIEKALKNNKQAQQFLTELGIDPLKDISTVTISSAGQKGDKAQAALTGKFNLDKIHASAQKRAENKKDELKISKVGDKPLYEEAAQGKTLYSGFPDEGTLIVSPSREYVADALGGKTGKLNKELANAIATVDTKQTIWAAGVVTEDVKALVARKEEAAELAKKLKAVVAGINISDALAVSLKVQTTDAKGAKDVGEFANQAKGILEFAGQSNEELKPFVDEIVKTLEIKTQPTGVSVKFQLSQDVLEKAIKKISGK